MEFYDSCQKVLFICGYLLHKLLPPAELALVAFVSLRSLNDWKYLPILFFLAMTFSLHRKHKLVLSSECFLCIVPWERQACFLGCW